MTTIDTGTAAERLAGRMEALTGTDPQFRAAKPRTDIVAAIRRPGLSLHETVRTVMTGYAGRPAVAERASETVTDPATGRTERRLLPRFATVTYEELWERAGAIAAQWRQDGENPVLEGDFVASIGFASCDYAALDLACVRLGAVAVPLQSGATAENLAPIVAETAPRLLASSPEDLDTAVAVILATDSVRRLVVFDHHPEVDDERERVEAVQRKLADAGSQVQIDSLTAVTERGRALPPVPEPAGTPQHDQLSLLIYTSGSTGTPKGAMFTDRIVTALWQDFWVGKPSMPVIELSFMPMSHGIGRALLYRALAEGGTSYFVAKSDLSTYYEDLSLVRPTQLIMVPRICDMLFQQYQSELDRRAAGASHGEELENAVKTDLRERLLGGRVLWAGTGSAPLSADMEAFVESVLQVELHNGYGCTEAGLVIIDHKIARPRVHEYQLEDVPELGYFTTDSPHPRGELLLKTAVLVPGYYKRPDVTAEVFDEDGFYHTGDIMAELAPDELVYVDRRKNVLKLSQGEFVAVASLEATFAAASLVRQVYVYGNSERAYLLAVIVPTTEALESAGGDAERLKGRLSESLQQIAKKAGLDSYQIPRDFIVETEPFTPENRLLSGIQKLLRPKLKEHYGDRLEALYAEIAERETSELRNLRQTGRDKPVAETVARAAQALLGLASGELSTEAHFTDLGGDSLSALTFSHLLREIFDVEVSVGVVISPANDLGALARYVEKALEPGTQRPTFSSVHGADSTVVRAADLTLDKFIDAETLAAAKTLPRSTGAPTTVLLTGANGFLGRFLCLQWLERLAKTGGRLVGIVRGSTPEAARARLTEAFHSGDPELSQHFRDLAAGHLEVLAADIGEPRLGLDETTWRRLAESVDLIVHPAALVNHLLPYDQLFGPNVVGTTELIRLALTARLKPVTYLSTAAVLLSDTSSSGEKPDIRITSPQRALNGGYANGYTTSKWAGEVLLREANDAFGLPVATFRSDMILAHSRYTGQLNVPDMFTRLLLSVIVTGIAPTSFYRTARHAHYDGLPVDFTAEAITALGLEATEGYRTYNVLNPHPDGVSLDSFVDWLVEAGYPIHRVDDFGTWLERFETLIRALPEKQKQHSLLPILQAFAQPADAVDGSTITATEFRAAVQSAGVGPDKDIPHVTKQLILKYAEDLKALGLI